MSFHQGKYSPGASAISGIPSSLPSVEGKPMVGKLCQQLFSSAFLGLCVHSMVCSLGWTEPAAKFTRNVIWKQFCSGESMFKTQTPVINRECTCVSYLFTVAAKTKPALQASAGITWSSGWQRSLSPGCDSRSGWRGGILHWQSSTFLHVWHVFLRGTGWWWAHNSGMLLLLLL